MNNLVTEWKKHSKQKHGSIAEGVRQLNITCGTSIQQGGIDLMEQGRRNIPVCVHKEMLSRVFISVLESYGLSKRLSKTLGKFLSDIVARLSPPDRV